MCVQSIYTYFTNILKTINPIFWFLYNSGCLPNNCTQYKNNSKDWRIQCTFFTFSSTVFLQWWPVIINTIFWFLCDEGYGLWRFFITCIIICIHFSLFAVTIWWLGPPSCGWVCGNTCIPYIWWWSTMVSNWGRHQGKSIFEVFTMTIGFACTQ